MKYCKGCGLDCETVDGEFCSSTCREEHAAKEVFPVPPDEELQSPDFECCEPESELFDTRYLFEEERTDGQN